MTLTTRQEATYRRKDWWQWSVWLDGSDQELDAVRSVTWHLHSTFPNPERKTDDRATKFRLDSAGWGEFTLHAVVEKKDGSHIKLSHDLILDYPPGADIDVPQRGEPQPRVFLSYSSIDQRLAENVRRIFDAQGIEILDPADIESGQDVAAEISVKLRKADYVVALLSDNSGKSVMSEIEMALKNRTPVVAVELGESRLSLPTGIPRLPLRSEREVETIRDSLLQMVHHAQRGPRKA